MNTGNPVALRMIMDSLRYWFSEVGVDGFLFDLAQILGRQEGDFDPFSAFFDLVAQDPLIRQAKLIAEPWDVGRLDSYDVGRFPPLSVSSSCGATARYSRWFTVSGTEMADQNWTDPVSRRVALLIEGSTDPDVDPDGTPLLDDDFLVPRV